MNVKIVDVADCVLRYIPETLRDACYSWISHLIGQESVPTDIVLRQKLQETYGASLSGSPGTGYYIALASSTGSISLSDTTTGNEVPCSVSSDADRTVCSAAVSPDRNYPATGSQNDNVTVGNIQTGERTTHSTNSEIMAKSCLWDVHTGDIVPVFVMAVCGHTSHGVALSPDGRKLAVHDERAVGWTPLPQKGSIAWSQDGTLIATASVENDIVSVWSLQDGIAPRIALEAWSSPTALTLSSDLSLLACIQTYADGSDNAMKQINIWDMRTGKLISKNDVESLNERTRHSLFLLPDD
ncbi:hypothetical protein CVT25_011703 [Psilocybe cyanescens]|uniref:Uncharacterized protein n=1 Tax=Psilocybe cyanescens TaxID=93625 RepID=A0A409WIJ9_PSICY|nr:hypothetical protein CVT25_011703 [Psilocybe cyanescens]